LPAKTCLSVQMFKLPNIWIFQTAAKSRPNIEICVFFPTFGRKVAMSGHAVFCPNFISTPISANLPIFQIYHIHFHTLGATAVVLQFLLDEVPIPDDVVCEMVMHTIAEHNLPPLTGERCHQKGVTPYVNSQPKRPCIKYDYSSKDASVLIDWVGAVPCFPDKQFECTFRIKHHMVDTILNYLVHRSSFWIKTVCRAGKETINLVRVRG